MADADSTLRNEPNAPTESHLAEEYPMNCDPFSVFYSVGTGLKWAINDEEGMAIAEAANYEDAVKIANAFRAGAYRDIVKAAHELGPDIPNDKVAEYRTGAMACLNAIRIIERIENHPDPDSAMEECWRDKDVAIVAMLQAAGVQSGFIAGFVATFAEYVSMVESGGVPDPYRWKPEAAMTKKEKADYRASYLN